MSKYLFILKNFHGKHFFRQKRKNSVNFFLWNLYLQIFFVNFFWQNFFGGKIFVWQNFFGDLFGKIFTNVTLTVGICSRWSLEPTFKVWSKSGLWQLRYGQMSLGQILPTQMSFWKLQCVQIDPRNLPLKFGQNQVCDSWDIPDMDKCLKDKRCLDKSLPHIDIAWQCILTQT